MKKLVSFMLIMAMLCAILPFSAIPAFAADSTVIVSGGKDYTITGCGTGYTSLGGQWPAKYDVPLTDGVAGEELTFGTESDWFGFYYKDDADAKFISAPDGFGSATIDLGEVVTGVNKFRAHLGNHFANGVPAPKSVKVAVSENGTTYTEVGGLEVKATGEGSEYNAVSYWTELTLSNAVSARYVKFTFELSGVFAFLNELEVYADPNAKPDEPKVDATEEAIKDAMGTANAEPACNVKIDMPAEYKAGDEIAVTVKVTDIKIDDLFGIAFDLCYDASELKLISTINSDNTIDCITKIPSEAWENISVLGDDEGVIEVSVVTTKDGDVYAKNDGDITLTFKFRVLAAAEGKIGVYAAHDTVTCTGWDDPATILKGNGDSALADVKIDPAFEAIVNMPEYYTPGETVEAVITIANITNEKLYNASFDLHYDEAVLKLINTINSDNTIDCVTKLPGAKWENLTILDEEGKIAASIVLAAEDEFPKNNGDITLTFRFEVLGSAGGKIEITVPDDSVNGANWDKPLVELIGSGSSASSTYHEHKYVIEKCDSAQHKRVCACGKVIYEAHTFENTVTKSTCEAQGYTTHTCSRCGDSYVDSYTKALGHKPGSAATCTKDQTCTVCGKVLAVKLGHDYKAVVSKPTCEAQGYTTHTCSRCGDSYVDTYTVALGHKPGSAATCTKDQTCTVCGKVLAEKLGHDYKAVVTKPTCEAQGYTTHTCSRCGDSYKDSYTNALGHKPGDWVTVKEPANGENGLKEQHCTVCGKTLESEIIPGYLKGDVNGDGKINAVDYQLAKRHVLKTWKLEGVNLMAADVNGDGKVNATDYVLIKRHVLKTYVIQ